MNIIITGGFEANFSVGFARGLAENGVELCVVSCDETAPRLTAARIANVNLRGSLAENRPAWVKLGNLCRYYARLILMLLRNRGATVHFIGIFRNELILWEGIFLSWIFRLLSGRYLYTVHNVLPHSRGDSWFFRAIYRRLYQIPNMLLVHTRLAREELICKFGVPEERIQLTSIGLNEEIPITGVTMEEARDRLGLEEREKCILYFGKIDEYKGLDVLLAAFDEMTLPETRMIIAGVFRNRTYRTEILTRLERMSRRGDVRLEERFIANEEVELYFKACDVLCLPYRRIYQSGLIFLSPRFGIPTVTTNVGSLGDYVTEEMGIVSRTNDAAGIGDSLTLVLSDPGRFSRAEIIKHGQKNRWINVCRLLLPLYAGPVKQGFPQVNGEGGRAEGSPESARDSLPALGGPRL